jgi:hypothetical protein
MSNAQPSGNTVPNNLPDFPYYDGPSFQGLSFLLKSSNGSPDHTLKIAKQNSLPFELAYITGSWQGSNGGSAKNFTGHVIKGQRVLSIACSWANGSNGTNTLSGTLTLRSVPPAILPEWFLQGAVTVTDQNGMVVPDMGPGKVSGYASFLLQP